jgi:hypothetical protein
MKRAQIEEARRHAAELHDEEEQAKLALLPPNENDFSVTAHLMRKHLERMNESLAETAKHARNAVLIQRLVVVPKLNTMDVLNELRLATHFTKELGEETDKTGNSIPSFRQWKFSKKTPTAMAFVQILFSLAASKKKMVRLMQRRSEVLNELKSIEERKTECRAVIEQEGYDFLRDCVQTDLEAQALKIKIKTSRKEKHILNVQTTDTVLRIKELMEHKDGVPIGRQTVIFQGNILVDGGFLHEYNLFNKCSIDVHYLDFPVAKKMNSDLREKTKEVLDSLETNLDEFEPEDFVEEAAYLREFLFDLNAFVRQVNLAKYKAKFRKNLIADSSGRKKRVIHSKKGRRSKFLHGYDVIVDPRVLVRAGQMELSRASMQWEDAYKQLRDIEGQIHSEFIITCQRTWRFKKWQRKCVKREAWRGGKAARRIKSLEKQKERKIAALRKAFEREQQLIFIRNRKAAKVMQRRFRAFMKRKYPPNGIRPKWEKKRKEVGLSALVYEVPTHKCHLCNFVGKTYDDLRNHLNEHKARDRQRKWRLEAEAAMKRMEEELWEKNEKKRLKRKSMEAKEHKFLESLRAERERKDKQKSDEVAGRLELGMDLPYTPEVAVLYLYKQSNVPEEVYGGVPGEIYLNKPVITIGRGGKAEVRVRSSYASQLLSRIHCTFFVKTHPYSGRVKVCVVDNNSTNGTFVNGFEVYPSDKTRVRRESSRRRRKRDSSAKLSRLSSLSATSGDLPPPTVRTSRSVSSSRLGSRGRTPETPAGAMVEFEDGVYVDDGNLVTLGCAPGRPSGHSFLVYQLEIKKKTL